MNTESQTTDPKFILLHPNDNTLTALKDLSKGDTLMVDTGVADEHVTLRADIGYAHKLARAAISKGADVVKYGEVIGIATEDIQAGDHVHIHNVVGKRAVKDSA